MVLTTARISLASSAVKYIGLRIVFMGCTYLLYLELHLIIQVIINIELIKSQQIRFDCFLIHFIVQSLLRTGVLIQQEISKLHEVRM